MSSYIEPGNANNQYLGHCNNCNCFEALNKSQGLCYKCRIKKEKDDRLK